MLQLVSSGYARSWRQTSRYSKEANGLARVGSGAAAVSGRDPDALAILRRDSRYRHLAAFENRTAHARDTRPDGSRSVLLYERDGLRLPRRGDHTLLQSHARVAGASHHAPDLL